jgi:hypothetical protein
MKPIDLKFDHCPVCHQETKDVDDLLNHIEENPGCEKGLEELANEVMMNPRREES